MIESYKYNFNTITLCPVPLYFRSDRSKKELKTQIHLYCSLYLLMQLPFPDSLFHCVDSSYCLMSFRFTAKVFTLYL